MTRTRGSLLVQCVNLTDFLNRVTDDLYQVLNDNEVDEDVAKYLESGNEDLVRAWKILRSA